MTATTTSPPSVLGMLPPPERLGRTPAVPTRRLVRVELRKLLDTRSGFWLLASIGVITAAAVAVDVVATDPSNLTFAHFVKVTVAPQSVLLPLLAVLAMTSEWTQRTSLVTHTLEPRRGRVVNAKIAATSILGLLVVLLALALAAVANVIGAALLNGDGSWAYGASGLRDTLLLQLLCLAQGIAVGMLLPNTAAALAVYFVLPGAFNLVFTQVDALKDAAGWVDLGTSQAPLLDHGISSIEWLHLLATTVSWIVLPFAVGLWRLLRREVK